MVKHEKKLIWLALWIIALVGIILMVIVNFTCETQEVIKDKVVISRTGNYAWKEHLMLPFYFTFISNVLSFTTTSVVIIKLFKGDDDNTKYLFRFKLLSAVSLTITLIVYWTILAPASLSKQTPPWLASNIFIHGLTPIITIAAFLYEIYKVKTPKIIVCKNMYLLVLMPLIWIVVATIIYYSLGGGYQDAVYSFLRYGQNPWWKSILYIIGIGLAFTGITYFYIWLNNRSNLLNKNI